MGLRLLCCLLTFVVLQFVLCDAQLLGEPGVCMRLMNVPKIKLKNVPCRPGSRDICRKTKKVFVLEERPACCVGWMYLAANNECVPNCKRGCKGGNCVAPETCQCTPPLILKNNNTCKEPVCNSPCVNAKCVNDDICLCNEGFQAHNATYCAPICPEGFSNDPLTLECVPTCDKCVNGNCTAPNTCICDEGYKLEESSCIPVCKKPCENGKCVAPDTCECNVGYSIETSNKSVCSPKCENTCVNATCEEPDKCTCLTGYEHSNSWTCKPKCDNCDHGDCVAPNQCYCSVGYSKVDGINCSPVCSETCLNGYCSAPNTCSCNKGYELDGKDKFKCHPICNDGCVHGVCSSPDICTCLPGFEKLNRSACRPLCKSCENGVCISQENCKCNEGFTRSNGVCKPVCSSPCINGYCESPEKCVCNDGFIKNITGSNCYKPCIGECENGICNDDGKCSCNSEYAFFNNTCIILDDCDKCNTKCNEDYCHCMDGRPCHPTIELPKEAAQSTSLAGLQMTWVLAGCIGILMVTIVIITIGYMWRKRKEYGDKPTDNGNTYQSVLYTIPNTLIQGNYNENRDSVDGNDDEDTKNDVSLHLLEAGEHEDLKRQL